MKHILFALFFAAAALAEEAPRNESTVVLDPVAVANLGIETAEAEETDFGGSIRVPGEIDARCESRSVVSSRIAGRVIEVALHEGEFAEAGQVVARVESRQPGDPPPQIELVALAGGLVTHSVIHPGAPVEPAIELMEIVDLSSVWAVAEVPQHHGAVLREGLRAKVRITAIGGDWHEAEFLRLGLEADAAKGTVPAVFELPNPGNRLRPGMRAEISLITGDGGPALSVPRAAVQGEGGQRFVFIRDYEIADAFVRVPVETGRRNEERVEIFVGLFPGDEVVVNGAYALAHAGPGSVSLKEALDAAHGHPHHEDGSEMTAEELASHGVHGHDHHDHAHAGPLTWFLGIACAVLLVLLIASPFVLRRGQPATSR